MGNMENGEKNKRKIDVKVIIIIVLAVCFVASSTLAVIVMLKGGDIVIPTTTNVDGTSSEQTSSEVERETIDMQKFKEYSEQYNVSAEYLQRFFDDVIVYKNDNGVQYAPIDKTLPLSNYDWNNLVRLDNEIQYQENGGVTTIKGIDVSKYQGKINWNKVADDGVEYAFIRIGVRGYGTGDILEDEYWQRNVEGAIAAGIDVGIYFYSQAITVEEAIEEAQFVLDRVKPYDIAYPIVFDFEEINDEASRTLMLTQQQRTDFTIAFCDKIKEAGYQTMVYGNIKWFVEMVDLSRLTGYDKWFAQYFKTPFFPYDFQIWQYTAKGKVSGIEGDVDLNISFKDYTPDDETSSEGVSS